MSLFLVSSQILITDSAWGGQGPPALPAPAVPIIFSQHFEELEGIFLSF